MEVKLSIVFSTGAPATMNISDVDFSRLRTAMGDQTVIAIKEGQVTHYINTRHVVSMSVAA